MPADIPKPNGLPNSVERLPAELYPIIISFVPRSDLPAIMRVSSTFYPIAARLLYTTLDVDLSRGIGPFEHVHYSHHHTGDQVSPSTQTSVLASLPSRFSYTTHLTLTSHSKGACRRILPPIMPNLISLRIRPIHEHDYTARCHCQNSPPKHFMSPASEWQAYRPLQACHCCKQITACHCPLLDAVRPSQLILTSMQTGLPGSAFAWPTPTSSLPAFVQELVVVVSAVAQLSGEQPFLEAIPATVKRLTLVVQRWKHMQGMAGEDGYGWSTEADEESDDDGASLSSRSGRWSEAMANGLSGNAVAMEVVGYDAIAAEWTAKQVGKQFAHVRRKLKSLLVKGGWSDERAEERAAGVKFMTGEEYIQEAKGEKFKAVRDVVEEIVIRGKSAGHARGEWR